MSSEEEQKKKREAILLEIEETKKQYKHFIEVKYPKLSFKDKVNYWYDMINSDIRDNPYGNSRKFFDKRDYKNWKKQEPQIDEILKEVMKHSYILGINKTSFYFQIGKYWKVLFP